MTEETTPAGQVPATAPVQSTDAPVVNQTPPPAEDVFDKDRAMATINALRAIEKQAKQDAKELARLKEAEAKRQESELTELQRVQKQAAELQAERDRLALDLIRRDIIAETGLPPLLADRLKGTNKEEMLADAQELLKVLPQKETTQQPATPHLQPTNPGGGNTQISDDARRAFLGLRRTT